MGISMVKTVADQKDIKLVNRAPDNLTIFADQKMISTIIRNLLFNAVKFTPRGGTYP